MRLQLKKPIIFFDLETTGLNITKDRIIEISLMKVYPDGKEEIKTRRINPEIPIPKEATAIHHITQDDVKDCPTFKEIAKSLASFLDGCDIAGYNSNKFDIPMLVEEFSRVGVNIDFSKTRFVDVQTIFHKMEKRTLEAAYLFYCNEQLDGAHSAEADTIATYKILQAQLDKYSDTLKNEISFLSEFSKVNNSVDFAGRLIKNNEGEIIINFGKYKGQAVKEVFQKDPGYYGWIMDSDFTDDTKRHFSKIRLEMGNVGIKNNK